MKDKPAARRPPTGLGTMSRPLGLVERPWRAQKTAQSSEAVQRAPLAATAASKIVALAGGAVGQAAVRELGDWRGLMTDTIKMLTPTLSLFTDRRLLVNSHCLLIERLLCSVRSCSVLGVGRTDLEILHLLDRRHGRGNLGRALVTGHDNGRLRRGRRGFRR
jgi:hypothetical protein